MTGVLITRGITPAIPAGGLKMSLDADGKPTLSCTLHVNFDVVPTWIGLALHHLKNAKEVIRQRQRAHADGLQIDVGMSLEREFEASMQAIMSAAIAIDAFYSVIKNHVDLPADLITQWRDKRTGRDAQVTEVVKRAFLLKPKGVSVLKRNVKELYRMRDQAVHPTSKLEAPVLHPDLNIGVEWRFVYFSASNAELAVNATTTILWNLAHSGTPNKPKVIEYMVSLRTRLVELMPNGHPSTGAEESSQ